MLKERAEEPGETVVLDASLVIVQTHGITGHLELLCWHGETTHKQSFPLCGLARTKVFFIVVPVYLL